MKIMRTFLIAVLAIGLQSFSLSAAEHIPVDELTADWQLDQTVDGVQVYLKKVECKDEKNGIFKEIIMVKLVNTTQQDIKLEWDMEFWYDGECHTCDPAVDGEYKYVVDLAPGEALEGNCTPESLIQLRWYVRFLNYDHIPKLSAYEMANLKVSVK